jgi:hypothetical protein
MSKNITYICDNDDCKRKTGDLKQSEWIEIGSDNNSLFINNHTNDNNLISMSRYNNIHFCSSKCFHSYLFKSN